MAAERVTARERVGFDLVDLAGRVEALADRRGLEGPDRPIPDGKPGARLTPAERDELRDLAELLKVHARALLGQGAPPVGPAATVGELRRVLAGLPADAPVLAARRDGCDDRAAAVSILARPVEGDGGWQATKRAGKGARMALLVVAGNG